MKPKRSERLSGEFIKEISNVISTKLKNRYPELSTIISVTYADIAPDLKSAKIFVSIYDTDKKREAESFKIISENSGFIRHELAQKMSLRVMPELRFHLDLSMEYGTKIDKIISELDIGSNDEQ